MVVVGVMIGYVLSAVVSTVINDQGWFATSGESPQARSYMVALLQREADTLTALRRQQAKPLSLTYLGGASQGRVSVQIYAVEVRANDGSQQLFSLALTLVGGQVVLTR